MENAFATMMNKLIIVREPVLGGLLTNLRSQGNKESYYRIDKINKVFDEMLDRREALSTILVKGYIDLAMYTQEMNKLYAEVDDLENEKKRVLKEISGDQEKSEMVRELLKWTEEEQILTGFNPDLFQKFVDKIIVCSREEVVFHLRCGLRLKERI